jgi:hypothetical protein
MLSMNLKEIMNTTSKTSKRTPRRRSVKVSEQRVAASTTPAAKIEEFLLSEGFHPTTAKEKALLEKHGLLGMPKE